MAGDPDRSPDRTPSPRSPSIRGRSAPPVGRPRTRSPRSESLPPSATPSPTPPAAPHPPAPDDFVRLVAPLSHDAVLALLYAATRASDRIYDDVMDAVDRKESDRSVYVRNLRGRLTAHEVGEFFNYYGRIDGVTLFSSGNAAVVCFVHRRSALDALKYPGKILDHFTFSCEPFLDGHSGNCPLSTQTPPPPPPSHQPRPLSGYAPFATQLSQPPPPPPSYPPHPFSGYAPFATQLSQPPPPPPSYPPHSFSGYAPFATHLSQPPPPPPSYPPHPFSGYGPPAAQMGRPPLVPHQPYLLPQNVEFGGGYFEQGQGTGPQQPARAVQADDHGTQQLQ